MISTLHKLPALILGLSLSIQLALAQAPLRTDTQDASDIVVHVKKDGATIIVDVEMMVHASPLAWTCSGSCGCRFAGRSDEL